MASGKDKTNGEKIWAYNYDIHTGAVWGIVGKTIAFFLSLFAASLPVTGTIIWWNRRKKKKESGKKKMKGEAVKPLENTCPTFKPKIGLSSSSSLPKRPAIQKREREEEPQES